MQKTKNVEWEEHVIYTFIQKFQRMIEISMMVTLVAAPSRPWLRFAKGHGRMVPEES
jgi:hypothetical protein